MKKRVMSLLLVLVMVFSLLPLSAMAQVSPVTSDTETVTVRFKDKSGAQIGEPQIVNKNGGSVAEGAIYDPGYTLAANEKFLGWSYVDGNGSTVNKKTVDGEDAYLTVEDVRAYVNDHWGDIGNITVDGKQVKGLDVTAVTSDVRYLVYMDEAGRVLKTQDIIYSENGSWDTKVDLDYVSTDPKKDFVNWNTKDDGTGTNYANDATITLNTATVELYPVCKEGFWLSFDNNIPSDDQNGTVDTTSATFVAPQFYVENTNTVKPADPHRPGYSLEGWYTDQATTQKYNFNQPLTEDMTLYAKWVADGTVTYRVNFWKQKTTDDPYAADADKTYDYYKMADSITIRSAHAGDMVSITNADTTRNVAGTGEDSYFFTYNGVNTDTGSVLVKGDGSTVLNVYYDRVPITFRFLDSSGNLFFNTIESGGASYTYEDPWDTGYYMIGKDGPKGANWKPSGGETLYSFDDLRKENVDDLDSEYKGDYFEYTAKSPNANNVYSTTNSDFTWSPGGTLYHHHNYWFAGREFAQFYYYENQSGTYPVGQGPDPDRPSESGATSGTHYQYVDPFADGYYIVGGSSANVPIVYNESNPPSSDVGLYYYHDGDYESSSLTSGMGSNFPQSTTTNPNNSNAIYYPSSPKGTYHWFEGYLYDYHTDWWNDYYHALYYKYTNRSGYYEVGTGPLPTAPGTHNVNKSEYTGLYGAKFDNWITPQSGRTWQCTSYYPLPLKQFVPKGQTTSMDFKDVDYNGRHPLTALGQDLNGSYTPGVVLGTAYCDGNGTWVPSETYEGFTIKQYQRNGYDSSPKDCTTTTEIDVAGDSLTLFYERHQHNFIMTSNNSDVETATLYYEAPLSVYGTSDYVPTNGPDGAYFDGWYADPGFTEPFDFNTTMPDNDVRVYAKWTTERFRVLLDPTGGDPNATGISFGNNNQVTSFRLDYGEKIEKNAIQAATRNGYQLVGWDYVDRNGERQPFNFDFNAWDQIADFEYAGAKDSERHGVDAWNHNEPWTDVGEEDVVGKVVIYARWRQVMDPGEYITVVYDPDNGGALVEDQLHYADAAQAIAYPASTSDDHSKHFVNWVILDKDGNETTTTVLPGDTFDVYLSNAKTEGTSHKITLKAVYESIPTTHVTWVANNGNGKDYADSKSAALNASISIEPTDKFTHPDGAVFLGWAKLEEYDAEKAPNGVKYNETTGWEQRALTADDVWLSYNASANNGEGGWFFKDGTETKEALAISADNVMPYNVLYAVWDTTDNHNYVIDFNGKMTIATSATAKKDDSHNNGAFNVAEGVATYQLKDKEDTFANGANLAFNGIDTALINGVPVGSDEGTTASWEKYTVIPANNVYFDDDLVGKSMTAGDGSGYNAEVSQYTGAADGQSKTTIEITFTGDGIDVYCTTPNANGWIQATVDGTNKQPYTNTKYAGGGELHNIPVISFRDLGTGEHTLVITTLTAANFQLDGIRVYNGMQDANETDKATVDSAYEAANEQNLVLAEVRQYLLDSKTFGSLTADDDDTKAFTGALFIDTKATGADVADYTAAGPKNEVYLNAGQGIAFQIQNWNTYKTDKVMVGLSVPKGGTATVAASGRTGDKKIQLNSETHMYYVITPDGSGNVYIYNAGSAMVSITDLKITGPVKFVYTAPPTVTPGEPSEGEGLEANFVVSKSLRSYVMSFDPEAVIEDPVVVDDPQTPDTPDTPDDGDKPGWNDDAYNPVNILKTLFKLLLESLSNLFGGLGNW